MSNQEAISLLRNLEDSLDSYCGLSEEGKTAFRMAIEALSSSEFPNSSDTISRKAAINAIDECYCGGEDSCGEPWIYESHAIKAIEQLPPIQPKRGKWIEGNHANYWKCSECGEITTQSVMGKPRHNYCPNCGADMKEVTT